MSQLQFYMDSQLSDPPVEWQSLELQLNFDNDNPSSSLSTKRFTFEGQAAQNINARVAAGRIFEGMPYKITDCGSVTALEGCIDTADAEYSCDRVVATVRDNRTADYLVERQDSFRFAYLESIGLITASDYVAVPYCISSIPDYGQIMTLSLTIFTITRETIDIIKEIAGLVAEAANPGTLISAVVKITLQLVYLAALIVALINLIQDLIDNVIQPKKHKLGMHVRTLLQKAAQHMGLTFSSTVFNNPSSAWYNAAIVPKKILSPDPGNFNILIREKDELQTPNESYGYYDGTPGDLLRDLEQLNIVARVRGTALEVERRGHWNNIATYTLHDIDLDGTNNLTYKYNAAELASNYFFSWQVDDIDLNTYDEWSGTNAQMTATLNSIQNVKNNLLSNLVEKRPNLALAKRKEVLNAVEKLLDAVVQLMTGLANAVISVINGILSIVGGQFQIPPLPGNIINNRVGWMKLSSDFIGIPKFLILDNNNEVAANNKTLTSAEYVMNNYHYVNWPLSDQWLLYNDVEIPFCCQDFINVLNNNVIKTFDNRFGKLISLRWQIGSDIAFADFKIRPTGGTYCPGITQTLIVDRT